jgi:hypothetical protein
MHKIILFCVFIFAVSAAKAQLGYEIEHKKDCDFAKSFFAEHQTDFENAAKRGNLSAKFLFALVAPEISQFSYLQNKVESYSLKVFYVQGGSSYANFSVGYFQMQPAFLERLENYVSADSILKIRHKKFLFASPHERAARVERVNRLNDIQWQMNYLSLFCVVVSHKFANTAFATEEEKLRFYSNAYNSGFHRNEDALKNVTGAYFPHFSKTKYQYADISLWFYEEIK